MNWNQSYSASWRVFRVNRQTWADGEMLNDVDAVSVSKTADGKLLESGSMEISGTFQPDYYRIVMTAEQGAEVERVDVATLLFDVNGGTVDFGTIVSNVSGYSVLYPASTMAVTTGEYAPAGADGAVYARDLLESAINAPVEVEGGFILNDHIVHELGSSIIDAVWAVLDAGDYIIQVDGYGIVHIRPRPTQPSLIIDGANEGLISNGIEFEADISEIPNRYIVIENGSIVTAVNSDETSPVSTVNRGYNIDIIDKSPTPVNGESYSEYANRKLHQASMLKDTRSYTREFAPEVFPYSVVRGSIDGLFGDYRVESQTIDCNNGITVNERASMEESLW